MACVQGCFIRGWGTVSSLGGRWNRCLAATTCRQPLTSHPYRLTPACYFTLARSPVKATWWAIHQQRHWSSQHLEEDQHLEANSMALSPGDPNSFSRPDEAVVTNIHLLLEVDFDRKVIFGSAELSVEIKKENADLVLDSRDLKIIKVEDLETKKELKFEIGEVVKTFGSPLKITLPKGKATCQVRVQYETSPQSSALQWLPSQQTAGKRHPYLFSQCQAIHCRSMVPCQDTPSVKAPYTAQITAPSELEVLMSAVKKGQLEGNNSGKRVHSFHQAIPIPSYLIAIVVGDIESRKVGPRSNVWAEKEIVEKAAYEFSETETMLKTAEELCGKYVWGIYDILVLPPSFPFGGMENPCLTFATPTLLAGDKSLADVIAHEISHSWTGNLVTNKNFEHFWLNEGFTVFVERKILGRMKGETARQFSAIGGWKELADSIKSQGESNPLTQLIPDLKGVDPDDSFSTVPYEKGHTFLYYLEEMVGGPGAFEPFLYKYLDTYKGKSLDSDEFKQFFLNHFKDVKDIDWDTWFYQPGMPKYKPNYDGSLAKPCQGLVHRWLEWDPTLDSVPPFNGSDLKDLNSVQTREFLALLLQEENPRFSAEKVRAMQSAYDLNSVHNSEVEFRWIRLGIRAKCKEVVPKALEFVNSLGRMKFVRPIYRDLYEWEEMRQEAIDNYHKHKSELMYVTAHTVAKDLHLKE